MSGGDRIISGKSERIAVAVRSVTKAFGKEASQVVVLDDVSVSIRENEFFTLLGPSGCGKTTLLRLIAGFEHPTKGKISLHGADISLLPPFLRPVNTVFQNYALFPHMTVAENVGFGLKMQGRPKAEVDGAVMGMLKLVRLEDMRNRLPNQMSGGQQQRVALARALAPQPKVLLLDEPLSALDLKLRKEMQIELKRIQSETGITFIFVTHDQEEALTMSDTIAVMSNAKILQVGTPREIYDHPADRFVANFIGESNIVVAELVSVSGNSGSVRLGTGNIFQVALPKGGCEPGAVTIAVRPEHVTISAPDADALAKGQVTNVVYFGTDTHYHLRLDRLSASQEFIVRVQNKIDGSNRFKAGDPVGIRLGPGSAQILRS